MRVIVRVGVRRSGREPEDRDAREGGARGDVRVRVRAQPPPQARDDRAQGEHPEAGRRPLPRDVHAGRQEVRHAAPRRRPDQSRLVLS